MVAEFTVKFTLNTIELKCYEESLNLT